MPRKHDLGEAGGVLERTGGFTFPWRRLPSSVSWASLAMRGALRGLPKPSWSDLGKSRGLKRRCREGACLCSDEQRAAFLFQLFLA